jgi:class 3 adenylate cyclase
MESVQNGCLVLADISGYTEYLGGVELEHCHDVLANLLGVVAGQMGGALRVAKFEGDAVFGYDLCRFDLPVRLVVGRPSAMKRSP